LTDIYTLYKEYCCSLDHIPKICSIYKFGEKLRDIAFTPSKSNGSRVYKIDYQNLKTLFDKQGWIHELDYEKMKESSPKKRSPLDSGIICSHSDEEFEQLEKENNYLKEKIKALQYDSKEFDLQKKSVDNLQKSYESSKRSEEMELIAQNFKTLQKKRNDEYKKIKRPNLFNKLPLDENEIHTKKQTPIPDKYKTMYQKMKESPTVHAQALSILADFA